MYVMTIKITNHDFKLNMYTNKLANSPRHPHAHPNIPPVHPLHPRCICVVHIVTINITHLPVKHRSHMNQ